MNIQELFDSFSDKYILVIGDVMIDSYLIGDVNRISPEAPVPVVQLNNKENRLGGAANVALNLKSLGAKVEMISMIGDDEAGNNLIQLFKNNEIEFNSSLKSSTRKTTVKTRIIGNKQQLLRIDDEQINDLTVDEENHIIEYIRNIASLRKIDAIIFEDYNKGVLTEKVIGNVIQIANGHNIVTTVDPKKKNFFAYQGVTLFKPNLKELKESLNSTFDIREDFNAFENAVVELNSRLNNKITMITLSELGVYIKSSNESYHFPAYLRDIADVSGAGDTVISVATLCLVSGCDLSNIAHFANIAGGLVCEETGVVSINKDKFIKEVIELTAKS